MLELAGVRKCFGAQTVLDGVDLIVGAGEALGLIGVNGAGKTTLIRGLLDLNRVDDGTISIDHGNHRDWPEWMGKIDFSALKLKLLSSIVAISAIQLLKQFMAINTVSDRDIMWLVIVHVVFVVSSVLLALSDRIAGRRPRNK